MRVLFLCTELSGYFANCIQLLQHDTDAEILVVYYPGIKEAPFEIAIENARLVKRTELTNNNLLEMSLSYQPDIVYVAGWVDKEYLKIARRLKRIGKKTICGIDNAWKGTIRQHFATYGSKWIVKPYFTHLWVAGQMQYQFAIRLGYTHQSILTGLYAADTDLFATASRTPHLRKAVFVGRLESVKNVLLLYKVFCSLNDVERNGWSLEIIGNGSQRDLMVTTETVSVTPFLQPKELIKRINDAGLFILPSMYEPWGVVVHEFAAAGKPLLLSTEVHSGEAYLIQGYNGYYFKQGDEGDLRRKMIHFFSLSDAVREKMGKRSLELAASGDPKIWVGKILSVLE